jgi:hypothetical protein
MVALAVRYLSVAAAFQLVDAAQAVAQGALRGLQDTRWPMTIALLGYWLPGFGTAVVLGFLRLARHGCVDRPRHRAGGGGHAAADPLESPRSVRLSRAVAFSPAFISGRLKITVPALDGLQAGTHIPRIGTLQRECQTEFIH